MVVVFPTPLTPTIRTTVGLAERRTAPPPMPRMRSGLGAQRGPHRVGVAQLVSIERLAQAREDRLGRLRTDVAGEHDLFHLLQDGRVDLFLALKERAQLRDEAAARGREALAEPGHVALRGRHRGPGRRAADSGFAASGAPLAAAAGRAETPPCAAPGAGGAADAGLPRLRAAAVDPDGFAGGCERGPGSGRDAGGAWSWLPPLPRERAANTTTARTTSATTMATEVVMGGVRLGVAAGDYRDRGRAQSTCSGPPGGLRVRAIRSATT